MSIDKREERVQSPAMKGVRQPDKMTNTVPLAIIAVLLSGVALYFMRSVVLPIILAIFFAALARPLQLRLQRFMPVALALVLTVSVTGAIFVALPILFATNLQVVIQRLPAYSDRFIELGRELEGLAHRMGLEPSAFDLSSDKTVQALVGLATNALEGLVDFTGTAILVLFLLVFLLAEANVIREKLKVALRPTNHAAVMTSVASMQEGIQRYVTTKTLFAALNAITAGVFTALLDIDFPLLWTLLTFILYFIPTFGAFIATAPPVLLALVQFDSPTTAIVLTIGLILIFNILGNVIEPRFLGKTLSLSPLVVFISLMFWGWYFGIIGVILSVPLTVGIAIICQNIEPLEPLSVLLADKPRRSSQESSRSVGDSS
jgi:AI-2 transport protein TqsA